MKSHYIASLRLEPGDSRAFGYQGHAPMVAREDFQDQAGFAPGVTVQNVSGLIVDAFHDVKRKASTVSQLGRG